ncbi:MAG: aldolase/citrate lyase family protein [Nitrospiraceae bacterium]
MRDFEFLLYATDTEFIRSAVAAGVDGVVIDWEQFGRHDPRSVGRELISHRAVADLQRVRASTGAQVVCRLNRPGPWTETEVSLALTHGADALLLPMVRAAEEVEAALQCVACRVPLGIVIETLEAVRLASQLAHLPVSRVHVGLQDLSKACGGPHMFSPLLDGTVERLRLYFTVPVGFGSLTLPELGNPVPCRLLIGELTRLNCGFSFLRNSFLQDIRDRQIAVEVPRLRQALHDACLRSPEAIARDRHAFASALAPFSGVVA